MATDATTGAVMRHLGLSTVRLTKAIEAVPGLDDELLVGRIRLWTPQHVRKMELALRFVHASFRRFRGGPSINLPAAAVAVYANPQDVPDDELAYWEVASDHPVVYTSVISDPLLVGPGGMVVGTEGLWPIEGAREADLRSGRTKPPPEPEPDNPGIVGEAFIIPIDSEEL